MFEPPPESTSQRFFQRAEMRMIGDGVALPDLVRVRTAVAGWSQWLDEWSALAEDHERRAQAAEDAGDLITAGDAWWAAALAWQYGQFMWFHDLVAKAVAQQRKELAYQRAAPLIVPAARRIEVPFRGAFIAAYERLPLAGEGPWPAVVMIGGLESTKEESRRMEDLLLARGVATITFDGPGQGETARLAPLDDRFDEASSAVLDVLLERTHIDPGRVGILGRSLGGFLAPLSAARDPRFAACVSFGALFDLSFIEGMDDVPRRGFGQLTGIRDPAAAEAAVRRIVDLSHDIADVRGPYLVVHGALDPLIPIDQATRTIEGARQADVTAMLLPDGDHCGHNQHHIVRPAVADWVAHRLAAEAPFPPATNRTA
jgi:2,6-dihydroxypseudooxynicotine hydrolase